MPLGVPGADWGGDPSPQPGMREIYIYAIAIYTLEPVRQASSTSVRRASLTSWFIKLASTCRRGITCTTVQVVRAINRCCRFTVAEITPLVVAGAVRKVQYSGNSPLTWHSRLRLLRYFLQRAKYDLLEGLELLPLANGGFTEVTEPTKHLCCENLCSVGLWKLAIIRSVV